MILKKHFLTQCLMSDLDDSNCEDGKVERPVTEEVNTGWRTVARDSLNTAQPRDKT